MNVWSLASGSSGNAYLVCSGPTWVLVDCGLPLRRLVQALAHAGVEPQRLTAVFLTHAHSDHLRSIRELSQRYGVPVLATSGTLSHPLLRGLELRQALLPGRCHRIGELEALLFRVPHDCYEPVGYRFEAAAGVVCLVTDLGHAPRSLLPYLSGARLLVLEANHDLEMLHTGPYPSRLKQRVASEIGHLSNDAAAELVTRIDAARLESLWLAHLSAVNNTPRRAKGTVVRRLAEAGLGHVSVEVAARDRPSLHWRAGEAIGQLPLL